jgi:hypothetical protein
MPGIGAIGMSNVGLFNDNTISQPSRYVISGVTRDASGNALGSCAVNVFETVSGLLRGSTISDASGNYNIEIAGDRGLTFFAAAYLPGSPDIAGVTVNTLIPA